MKLNMDDGPASYPAAGPFSTRRRGFLVMETACAFRRAHPLSPWFSGLLPVISASRSNPCASEPLQTDCFQKTTDPQ